MKKKKRKWNRKSLGFLLIPIILIILTIIILIFDRNKKAKNIPETTISPSTTAVETIVVEDIQTKLANFEKYGLQEEAVPEISELIGNYQKAKVTGDVNIMLGVYGRTVEDEALANKLAEDKRMYESFTDTICYETKGVVEDSYLVFISTKIKFRFVDTLASNLTWAYVQKQTDGTYIMKDPYNLSTEETAYLRKIADSNQVKEMAAQSRKELAQAVISDPELANMYKLMSNSVITSGEILVTESTSTESEDISEAQISIIEESTQSDNIEETISVEESTIAQESIAEETVLETMESSQEQSREESETQNLEISETTSNVE